MFHSNVPGPRRPGAGLRFSAALLAAFTLLFGPAPESAAQNTASISGIVSDATGAVVPGAEVTITREETGTVTNVSTNEVGSYTAAALEVGLYTVEVQTAGFKSFRSSGIVLNVRDRTVIDVALELGEVTETIEVIDTAVQLQTENATVEEVVSGRQVENLAMNGRNFMQLASLVPGASSTNNFAFNTPTGVGSGGAANISFNGMRRNHNVWRVDGQENYDRGCGGCVEVLPSIDAIQEFKVSTANAESDAGFGAGGQINIAIKSGTQSFHGTFYEFVRNDAFDANRFFANLNGRDKPKLRYNNYGYNIGGPISFGGYNRDKTKTFFFWNHEWRSIRRDSLFNRNAASAAMRGGDFSAEGVILDPDTGQPFPDNRIPSSRIDPNATLLADPNFVLPLPNTDEGTFIGVGGSPLDVHQEILRVDQNVNDKNRIMFRFIMDSNKQIFPTTQWSNQSYPTIGTEFTNPPKKYMVQWTSTLSPNVVNETMVGFSRQPLSLQPTGNYERPGSLSVPELYSDNRANRIPNLLFQGALNVNINTGSWPWTNVLDTWQFRNNTLWSRGNHTIRFGAEYMPFLKQQDLFGPTQGQFTFQRGAVGHEFGSFLLGQAFRYSELELQTSPIYQTRSGGLWVNDTWRINPRVTLNLAVRYDMLPHSYEENDQIAAFFPALHDSSRAPTVLNNGQLEPDSGDFLNGIGVAGANGIPRGLTSNHWALITPKAGLAVRLFGDDTVLRLGYGMFHERIQGNDIYNIGPNPPFSFTAEIFNTRLSNPGGGAAARFPGGLRTYDGIYKIPQVQNWNFGIQHRHRAGIVFNASYVGSAGSYLQTVRDLNQPAPEHAAEVRAGTRIVNQARPYQGWAAIRSYENSTNSSYHSLQASVRTEDWKGLTLQTSYTLARSYDYTSGDVGGTKHQDSYNPRAEYGPSDYDRRHILLFSYVYDLPTPDRWNSGLKWLLGNWTLSGISAFQTGTPLNIGIAGDPHGIGGCPCRPNAAGEPNLSSGRTRDRFFNTDAFSAVTPGTFGNLQRNAVRRAGTNNFDISLFKNFPFGESAMVQFRAEAFNAFNHTQWTGYRTTFGGGGFGNVTSARDARVFQLGLKFKW